MALVSHGAPHARGRSTAQWAGFAALALALLGIALELFDPHPPAPMLCNGAP
jgi:hypothetical protein